MNDNNYLIKFWAKTSPNKENAFHPLICHLIDVAAVTQRIWQDVLPTATKERIAKAFGETNFDKETLEKVGLTVAFIAGLHDLGKCSPPFALRGKQIETQKKSFEESLAKEADKTSERAVRLHKKIQTINFLKIYEPTAFHIQGSVPVAKDAPHGYVTTIELPEILTEDRFGLKPKIAEQIGVLIGGHHGVFPSSNDLNKLGSQKHLGNDFIGKRCWKEARWKLADALAELFQVKPLSANQTDKLNNGTIMILAGLVSVADWIGSDEKFFECEVENFNDIKLKNDSLEKYFQHAQGKAIEALDKLGWLNWAEYRKPKRFQDLFPFKPRGSQIVAIEIAKEIEQLKKAGIIVVEEPMGIGKTETAMFIGDTFNAVLGQRGFYFALPTQATSNQMFGRVLEFLFYRFEGRNAPALLSHGKAALEVQKLKNQFLERLKEKLEYGDESVKAQLETLDKDAEKFIHDIFDECSGEDCLPDVVAKQWFTSRKRGTLAPFGVGTVDQALMSILQTRHYFVRLFGLANKTVIIDEVHAYDEYMFKLLECLLEWLAALDSPVILLSATLPVQQRDKLIKAYQIGLEKIKRDEKLIIEGEDKYPRISYAVGEAVKVRKIKQSESKKTLHIEWIDEVLKKDSNESSRIDESFVRKLKSRIENDGGCVAIICNTVARSQEIFDALRKDSFFKDKLDLLHARFRFCDREERVGRVLGNFGKPEHSPNRPTCSVLVSTQIIEQSLDLDFDLMISDLAPADLLLQRAGRLQRHDRDSEKVKEENKRPKIFRNNPTLWIIKPPLDKNENLIPDKNGLPDFGDAGIVYHKHILLRTWLEMNKKESISIPNKIEDLIEAVYDKKRECPEKNYSAFWEKSKEKMDERLGNKKQRAEFFSIMEADEPDLFTIKLLNLDEDNPPEIHKDLRAVTRDNDLPDVSVIILKHDELKDLDSNIKPNEETTKFLLRREAKISKFDLTDKIIDSAELKPKGWKKSQYLRHYRLLRLDENNEIKIDKARYVVSLDEDLGIVIKEEKKNG